MKYSSDNVVENTPLSSVYNVNKSKFLMVVMSQVTLTQITSGCLLENQNPKWCTS